MRLRFLYDEELRRRVKSGEFDMLERVGGDGSVLGWPLVRAQWVLMGHQPCRLA
jgi:hypothetical protein